MLKPTMDAMLETVGPYLQPGEEIVTVGWASQKGTKYFYVALTSTRLLAVKLSMFYKPKGEQSWTHDRIAKASLEKGFTWATPDVQAISALAETSFHFKTVDGKKEVFRFARIAGLENQKVAVDMVNFYKERLGAS